MIEKEVDIDIKGKCRSTYHVVLNMDDILNIPSVDIPIHERLKKDFGVKKKKKKTIRQKIKCKKGKTCKVKIKIPPI